jgi:hypothetical protein
MTCKTITVEEERLARYRFCDSVIDSIERDCGDYLSYGECADLAHEIWAELPHSDRLKYYEQHDVQQRDVRQQHDMKQRGLQQRDVQKHVVCENRLAHDFDDDERFLYDFGKNK